jgi:hypothetical protein
MSDISHTRDEMLANASREEIMAALFANMVIQQTNMAMMMLGKMAHPETGEFIQDIEAARMFIDQLEMIEAKTKGNLSKQEEALLKQSLTALRMAFVEAVDGAPAQRGGSANAPEPQPQRSAPMESTDAAAPKAPAAPAPVQPAPEETRKKFSKKY